MTKTSLNQLAVLAVKLDKKTEFLKNRIEHAKKQKTNVYFMVGWLTVDQAEHVLKKMDQRG